jgi:SAM-dependent methyltransferase
MSHSDSIGAGPAPRDGAAAAAPAGGRHGAVAEPSAWVARWLRPLAAGARVLDFAAGSGRHARFAAALGARVLAVDRDAAALAGLREPPSRRGGEAGRIETAVLDLEAGPWQLEPAAYDAVIVTNYLFRPRLALVCGLLAPGGLLVYETFALGNEAYGKPSNPDYLLREGELLERARHAGLTVLGYESGYCESPKPAIVQRLCAARPPIDRRRLALDRGAGPDATDALG